MPLDEYIANRPDHPWLAVFLAAPDACFDEIVRGVALIPPFGLADAQTVLPMLFEPLDPADPLLDALDGAACRWIERTRRIPPDQRQRYGLKRYWRDVTEALTVVQLLPLTKTRAFLRDNYFDFLGWVSGHKPFGSASDPRARFWLALAKGQTGDGLRRLWPRICAEVGSGVLPDHYMTVALAGLRNLPGTDREVVPQVLAGIAAWGAELTDTDKHRREFIGEFQALMWIYPKAGRGEWRPLVEPILRVRKYEGKPFVGWWAELLSIKNPGKGNAAVREPVVRDVHALVDRIEAKRPLAELESEIRRLMNEWRVWAEVTGDASYLSLSVGNIGARVLDASPKLTLKLVTEALDWAPNDAVLWNLWGRALVKLGRRRFAEAVFWEADRRFPHNEETLAELARLLAGCGRTEEALAVLQEAACRFPDDEASQVELARLLAALGQMEEALARLRSYIEDYQDKVIAITTLGHLLVNDGQPDAAREVLVRLEEMRNQRAVMELRAALRKFETDGAVPLRKPQYNIDLSAEDMNDDPSSPEQSMLEWDARVTRADHQLAAFSQGRFDAALAQTRRRDLAALIDAKPDDGYARMVWADRAYDGADTGAGMLADFSRVFELRLTIALNRQDSAELERIAADFKEYAPLTRLAAIALEAADDETLISVAKWLLREPPPAGNLTLHHAHWAVWAALTTACNTPRDQDAIADDLPAIRDAIADILRQSLRMVGALSIAA